MRTRQTMNHMRISGNEPKIMMAMMIIIMITIIYDMSNEKDDSIEE